MPKKRHHQHYSKRQVHSSSSIALASGTDAEVQASTDAEVQASTDVGRSATAVATSLPRASVVSASSASLETRRNATTDARAVSLSYAPASATSHDLRSVYGASATSLPSSAPFALPLNDTLPPMPLDSIVSSLGREQASATATVPLIFSTTLVRGIGASDTNNVVFSSPSPFVNTTTSSNGGGLSTTSKAILGGVLGGLGGLGLICALVLVILSKGNKRKRPESLEPFTPQRMTEKPASKFSSRSSRIRAALTVSTARSRSPSLQRTRKNSEPPSPTTARSFQVISGRRLSSPPSFYGRPGEATRQMTSTNSSPRSGCTTPSRRSRLGGTPIIFRAQQDAIGRSQDTGSTLSHVSRFVERLDDA